MPSNDKDVSELQVVRGGRQVSLSLEQRESLKEAEKLVAFIQFALACRDMTEFNREAQAGCVLLLDQIREAVRRVSKS